MHSIAVEHKSAYLMFQFLQILNGKNCDSILLKNVTFSPWTAQKAKKISTVIVHFATVIGAVSVKEISFFHPFASILKDIEDLKVIISVSKYFI